MYFLLGRTLISTVNKKNVTLRHVVKIGTLNGAFKSEIELIYQFAFKIIIEYSQIIYSSSLGQHFNNVKLLHYKII